MAFKPLKLIVQDKEDLAPVSAALQDAVAQLGDFHYEPSARRFTLAFNRYRWEAGDETGRGERVRTALQAGGVLSAKGRRLKQNSVDAVVNLLAIAFKEAEAPGGVLEFTFSGGGALRLDVECLDLVLADVSEPWRAAARPHHEAEDDVSDQHLVAIELDERSIGKADANVEHERRVAIADLLDGNVFAPAGSNVGPYALRLAIEDQRLVFDVQRQDGAPVHIFVFSLGPLRRILKDYLMMCDSYYEAVRDSTLAQIEAIDMGRRGVHNEGSTILRERLAGKIDVDFATSRRLFTLICALHRRKM